MVAGVGLNLGCSEPGGEPEQQLQRLARHAERVEDLADGAHVEVGPVAERPCEILRRDIDIADRLRKSSIQAWFTIGTLTDHTSGLMIPGMTSLAMRLE